LAKPSDPEWIQVKASAGTLGQPGEIGPGTAGIEHLDIAGALLTTLIFAGSIPFRISSWRMPSVTTRILRALR